MNRILFTLSLGFLFTASHSKTQLISTHQDDRTSVLNSPDQTHLCPELAKNSTAADSGKELQGINGITAVVQHLREALRESINKSSTLFVEEPDNTVIVQNELLSNYYGINSTTKIDRVTYSSIKSSAVDTNNAEANYYLGLICLYALNSPSNSIQNKHCAINHFRSAAAAGHPTAQCAIGILYSLGIDSFLNKDNLVAIDWFRKASHQNNPHPRSHWLLAQSLYQEWASKSTKKETGGEDLNVSVLEVSNKLLLLDEIIDLLHIAKRNSIPDAVHLLAVMYEYELVPSLETRENASLMVEHRRSTEYEENMAKAVDLYQEASELGCIESNYHLGLMHTYGRGIVQDSAAAMECFRRGAMYHHHPPSMRYLAILAANGNSFAYGVPQYGLAVFWFDRCYKRSQGYQSTRTMCLEERDKLIHLMTDALGEDATYDLILQESLLSTSINNRASFNQ